MDDLSDFDEWHYSNCCLRRRCLDLCCPQRSKDIDRLPEIDAQVRREQGRRERGMTTYANSAVQYMNSTGSRPRKYSNKLNKSVRGRATKVSRNMSNGYKRTREGGQIGLWTTPRSTEIMATDIMCNDLPVQSANAATATSFVLLNGITAGSAFYERRGRKIGMDTLRVDVCFRPIASLTALTVTPTWKGRFIIFYDRQANGTIPTIPNLLLDVNSATPGGSTTVWSNPNLNGRDQYMILMDERFVFPGQVVQATAGQTLPTEQGTFDPTLNFTHFKRYIKLKSLVAQYSGDTTGIGSIQSGALWAYFFREGTAAASDPAEVWRMDARIRLRFSDP